MSALVSRSWIRSVIARAQLLVLSLVYTVSPRLGAALFRAKLDTTSREDELRTERQILRAQTRTPNEAIAANHARGASYVVAFDNRRADIHKGRQVDDAANALQTLHDNAILLAMYRRRRKD